MSARYRDAELERMLENWRRYMTGEYRNPLDVKISAFYRIHTPSGYRGSREPLILGDFRDVDAAISALPAQAQLAIRADVLEVNATQRQKAWHCGLNSERSFARLVDLAKRQIRATLDQQRQRRADHRGADRDAEDPPSRARARTFQ